MEYNLGDEVVDKMTSFRGQVESRMESIHEAPRYNVVGYDLIDGKPVEIWISEGRLIKPEVHS